MTPDEAARWLAADPSAAGLFCDLDGTLAPIVPDPTTTRLEPEARDLLGRLASRLGVVAVISGRPAAFLRERAAAPGVLLLGLYGLETATDSEIVARPEIAGWQPIVESAKQRLAGDLDGRDGIWVEDKGRTVAVHWRNAPDQAAAERMVDAAVSAIAEDTGLAVEPGKLVAELRPPTDWDKGAAVAAAADERGLRRLTYVGDDLGDLPALEAARARGGIAIGVEQGGETPAQVRAAADLMLDGHDGVRAWLRRLDRVLG